MYSQYATYFYSASSDPSQSPSQPGCVRDQFETVALLQKTVNEPLNLPSFSRFSVIGGCAENARLFPTGHKRTVSYSSNMTHQIDISSISSRMVLKFESFDVNHINEFVEYDVFNLIGTLLWGVGMVRVGHLVLFFLAKHFVLPFLEEHQIQQALIHSRSDPSLDTQDVEVVSHQEEKDQIASVFHRNRFSSTT